MKKKAQTRAAGKQRTRGASKAGKAATRNFKLGGCMFNAPQQSSRLQRNIKKK